MRGFFLDFIKVLPLQLNAGKCAIKTPFELDLLIHHALHFQVFNAKDNLEATRATHLFLGVNENFTKLKISNKSLFWHVFEEVF